jgi:hypothetical protein
VGQAVRSFMEYMTVRSFMEYMNGLVGFTNQFRISSSVLFGGINLVQRVLKLDPVDSARTIRCSMP